MDSTGDLHSDEAQLELAKEDSMINSQGFPSLAESYGKCDVSMANPSSAVRFEEKNELFSEDGSKRNTTPEVDLLNSSNAEQFGESAGEISNPSRKDWRALFPKPGLTNKQASLKFTAPAEINGKRIVAASSDQFSEELKKCENRVVGFFVGKRLSFSAVQAAVRKLWSFKMEVRIKLYNNCAFIFEFDAEDDRRLVLDTGSFYIANHLFCLKPWSLLLEKSIADINTMPIWVLIYGIPLHMWDSEGLGMIASFLGKPILADTCTLKQDRLAYARICVEIDAQFDYPDNIPVLIDGKFDMELPVEYPWKPAKCEICIAFGHTSKNCTRKIKQRWTPKKSIAPTAPAGLWGGETCNNPSGGSENRAGIMEEAEAISAKKGSVGSGDAGAAATVVVADLNTAVGTVNAVNVVVTDVELAPERVITKKGESEPKIASKKSVCVDRKAGVCTVGAAGVEKESRKMGSNYAYRLKTDKENQESDWTTVRGGNSRRRKIPLWCTAILRLKAGSQSTERKKMMSSREISRIFLKKTRWSRSRRGK